MLVGMDIPVTAGPWLGLGLVLGILLPALAALGVLALRRRDERGRSGPDEPAAPSHADFGQDDLPGFLESPPGSAATSPLPTEGWTTLAAAAAPRPAPDLAPARRPGTPAVLAAMATAALLLIGAAAAVAAAGSAGHDDTRDAGPGRPAAGTAGTGDVSARLTFAGVVLERHVVGVTVAYPRVLLSTRSGGAAEVELVTFNCLRAEAPEDPVAAGCVRSVPEYAELSAPDLGVAADDGVLRVSGSFATSRRPNGSAPVPTGRAYELTVEAAPADGRAGAGREPATGMLRIGEDQVGTSDAGPNDITYAG
jgi:hypothetical protein